MDVLLEIIDLRGQDASFFRKLKKKDLRNASVIIDHAGNVVKNRLGYMGEIDPDKVIEKYIKWRDSKSNDNR